ncbi:DHA2 family efflux MFS transporter permease subunit [Enemella sp. A6]|uniref:DHA2 family efflux MFS transporter permease subunit n=1 Tax=Enemella sp. A6 TaxID=3440152 RepID=UPI003EBD450D
MSDVISERDAWRALWALVIGFFMILVDSTIVSVATPALMVAFDADIARVLWVTSAYLLGYAVPLLIAGRLGDRFGPRRLYLTGLFCFTLFSVLCGLAVNIEMLIVMRLLQGLSASLMTPQTMAIVTRLFPAERRGPALGLWGAVAGAAVLVGPLAGGLLVGTLGWQWIFFVNLPVGLFGLVLAYRRLPVLEINRHRFDILGVVLSAIGLFCFIFGLEEAENFGWGQIWGPVTVWRLIIAGLVVLMVFIGWQAVNRGEPLVPLQLFRDRNFSIANLAITAMGFTSTAMVFPMMIYTQVARGLSPTQAALLTLPMAISSGVLGPVVGMVMHRINPRWFAMAGFFILSAALVGYWFAMRPDASVLWLLLPSLFLGIGSSGIWGPLSISATRNLPAHRAGAGAGVYNTTRQMGAVVGSAAIAVWMQARLSAHLPGAGHTTPTLGAELPEGLAAPFARAMGEAVLLPAAVAAVGFVGVLFLTRVVTTAPPAQDGAVSPAGR